MTPATAYLSFTIRRAGLALGLRHPELAEDIDGQLARADRRELARYSSGLHGDLDAASTYAHREGPMLVLTPEGEVLRFDRQRDAGEDERVATEERASAEQRRLQPAERWQTEPRPRAL